MRQRQAAQAQHHRNPVSPLPWAQRGDDAQGHPRHDGQAQRAGAQRQRAGQALQHDVHRRPLLPDGIAEIEQGNITQIVQVLRPNRAIHAQRLRQHGSVGGGRVHRQHRLDRVAHQARHDEHDGGHAQHNQQPLRQAAQQEARQSAPGMTTR
ncbi:hypothetical protein D3C87_1691640 [compost metagenome]